TVEKALGRPAKRKMLPMQKGDVPRTFASPDLLMALTGYKPDTTLEVGVKAFVDWYLEAHRELDRQPEFIR
ncbi:UDP-glucuronate 5-epimerase, partial [Rhizobium sp. S152]|nr:UDP-glucuronate 5-epimerase [Rhizobium sp. S152]